MKVDVVLKSFTDQVHERTKDCRSMLGEVGAVWYRLQPECRQSLQQITTLLRFEQVAILINLSGKLKQQN